MTIFGPKRDENGEWRRLHNEELMFNCETWSLTLREESRLRVFQYRILRRIFRPRRDANGEWRRLHNEGINSLHSSPNIVRVIKS